MNRFLIKANIRHNGFYDYSKTVYVDAHTKIKIICPLHGEFLQRPANHLQGQGCTNCGLNKRHKKKDFIKEAKEKWGSIYDYTLTNYINKENKIDYTCLQHGLINQNPIFISNMVAHFVMVEESPNTQQKPSLKKQSNNTETLMTIIKLIFHQ